MKRYYTILMIIIFAGITSCNKEDPFGCFKGAGKTVEQERNLGDFNGIIMHDNLDVILIPDSEYKVVVEAGRNLQKGIKTGLDNGILEIRNENGCNWVRSYDNPLNVFVHYITLDSIEYRSSGNLTTQGTWINDSIKLDVREGSGRIQVDINTSKSRFSLHYGTADIHVTGTSNVNFISSSSYGLVDCAGLSTTFTYMSTSSTNDCYVDVSYVLEVIIENAGNIYYRGDPSEIKEVVTGEGRLIRLE